MKYYRVVDDQEIELTPEEVAAFLAQVPPSPEPQAYRLYKSVFIRRLVKDENKDEAEIMEQVLAQADAQLRLLFNSVEFFLSDDPLFETLHAAVGSALGEARADELLAPEA